MTKARDIASAAPAPSTVSATEIGYLDGVTSAIQTQIDGKQAANANVSTTELGYLDGVTSAIQTQLDAKIPKTLTTTTGDIIYASSANTPARLGIGSTSQVLTVSGGVPTWATPAAGGMTLISTTTLSSTSTTISVAANSYKNLYAVIRNLGSSNNTNVGVRINSKSGATDYNIRISGSNAGSGFNYSTSNSFSPFNPVGVDGFGNTSDNNGWVEFADCNSTSAYKVINSIMGGSRNGYVMNTTSSVAETAVISGITFVIFDSYTFTGGTVLLYGVS